MIFDELKKEFATPEFKKITLFSGLAFLTISILFLIACMIIASPYTKSQISILLLNAGLTWFLLYLYTVVTYKLKPRWETYANE